MIKLFSIKYFGTVFTLFLTIFLLREYFTYKKKLFFKYLLSPLVTFIILIFVVISFNSYGVSSYSMFILFAIIMSLIADTLMMIEEADLMKFGIIFFLLAHVMYISAFLPGYSFKLWNIAVVFALIIFIKIAYSQFAKRAGDLKIPVIIYITIISIMMFFAATELNSGFTKRTITIGIGALLFVISDCVIAYNVFVTKIPHSSVITWAIYAPSQLILSFSCFFS